MELIFEKSINDHRCTILPKQDIEDFDIDESLLRKSPVNLPEIAEVDLVRHYTNLSKQTFGVDNGFYPLGSCTMKYNPKVNETCAALKGFTNISPNGDISDIQGALEVIYASDKAFCEITAMDKMVFQPGAGAHGEFTGLLMIKKYHCLRNDFKRNKVIIPDSAHGTNPASATMNGYSVVTITSKAGLVDLDELDKVLDDSVAALMLTNPNTLGLYDSGILEITKKVHSAGALCYYDGANLNAIMGICKPGDMGFDCIHLNLHKTFSTPHGGGGPGVGAFGCKDFLIDYLPNPIVEKNDNKYYFKNVKNSIGKVTAFYGNFLVLVKALAYIKHLGSNGIKEASENAVLNANYMMAKLKHNYNVAFDRYCMHEFVLDLSNYKNEYGIRALDICKRMMDFDMHPPTMYFPLIVHEALMFEPTETESKQTLDEAVEVLIKISNEVKDSSFDLSKAPFTTKYCRLDEVKAARNPVVRYEHKKN
jgi:glycine dehydrogenase subunit 2